VAIALRAATGALQATATAIRLPIGESTESPGKAEHTIMLNSRPASTCACPRRKPKGTLCAFPGAGSLHPLERSAEHVTPRLWDFPWEIHNRRYNLLILRCTVRKLTPPLAV